ncbi:hrq family protein 2 [Ophiostoma piceae UAMH 11346]|uniref:Hrq family protein 2 n=1 Tax=Ophiostoma piceae (strain UAMH 11346) TaxID=1262450 RepID=S3C292_OPHP1|nr:hrq family protein 2 [Ophiostoma piceae UAMH 11346]
MATLIFLVVVSAILIGLAVGAAYFKKETARLPSSDSKYAGSLPSISSLPAFSWQSIRPTQFRPFKRIYHITMALQSTSPDDLIVIDQDYKDRIELRRDVIANNKDTIMGVLYEDDGFTPQAASKDVVDEIYEYLMSSYLPARFPTIFTKEPSGDGKTSVLYNRIMGSRFPCAPPLDPLEAFRILGETVEDDLFILKEEDTTSTVEGGPEYPSTSHRVVAFLCCFPSGFDPKAKLGLLLKDVHKPVPSYDKIGPSMERFFSKLEAGKSAKRLNRQWSVQTHTNLFTPTGNHIHEGEAYEDDADVDIDTARFRVECQTITRLPQTRGVLFSFKTYLFPIKEIKAEGMGPSLADAVEGLKSGNAPGMWTYKGGVRWGKSMCAYLRG